MGRIYTIYIGQAKYAGHTEYLHNSAYSIEYKYLT